MITEVGSKFASHLDFYGRHEISPVRQDLSDLEAHFARRAALYRQLGLPPRLVAGATVVEVGPGSGHNALHTASLEPARYLLVEGNPRGVGDMQVLFAAHPHLAKRMEIVLSRIEDFRTRERFDLVLSEGLLSGVPNPEEVLNALDALAAPGAVLVITCVDHLSHFPETVRRALARRVVPAGVEMSRETDLLVEMFESHLATLGAMSRRRDDWVVDNLIHPGSIIPLINFPEAVALLADRYVFHSSSPRFVADWRWYKAVPEDGVGTNARAIESYWRQAHNLLDHRCVLAPRAAAENQRLYDLCTRARADLEAHERAREHRFLGRFVATLDRIVDDVQGFNEPAAAGLAEARDLLTRDDLAPDAVAEADLLAALFGRGQQYLSLIKNA